MRITKKSFFVPVIVYDYNFRSTLAPQELKVKTSIPLGEESTKKQINYAVLIIIRCLLQL